MQAFLPISPIPAVAPHTILTTLKPYRPVDTSFRKRIYTRRPTVKSNISSPDSNTLPRFRRDKEDASNQPQTSFFPNAQSATNAKSPNDRVLNQVRETMDRLGVSDNDSSKSNESAAPSYIDISNANPLSAFAGAAGAACISIVAWKLLNATVQFSVSHPVDDQIYVVQRLAVVVRTTLVCLFALGSGISGVTALGLALLGVRTSYGIVTGEFSKNDNPSSDEKRKL